MDRLLEQVVEAAPVGHVLTDATGAVLQANPAVLRWLGRPELEDGIRFADLLPRGQRVVWQTHHLPELERSGRLGGAVLDLVGPDRTVPVLVSATLLPIAEGPPLVGITLVDATERRSYERDLLLARRAAEQAGLRLRLMQRITEVCAGATTATQLLDRAIATLVDGLGAERGAAWLAEPDTGEELRLAVRQGVFEEELAPVLTTVAPPATTRALARGEVVLARDPDEVRAHLDGLAPAGGSAGDAGAGLLLPFRYDGTWLGVAMVLFAAEWRGDDQDLRDLSHAGALVGQSLERLRLQETLRRLATSDALTGLPNRRALRERLEQALDRSERDDTPLVVVFVDLDGFKAINDRLGHAAGDLALTAAAARLRSAVRTADVVARLGGDEFVVLSEGGGPDDVRHLVERLHAALGEPFEIDGEPVTLAASIGVAARGPGDPPTSADQLLDRADGQMYAVKAARRRGR